MRPAPTLSLLAVSCLALSLPTLAEAAGESRSRTAAVVERLQQGLWSADGGMVQARWNTDLAADLGMDIREVNAYPGAQEPDARVVDLREATGLQFRVENGYFAGFAGGSLQAAGGFELTLPDGRLSLAELRLVPRPGEPDRLDLVGADGEAWFYVDRLMHHLAGEGSELLVRTSDIVISDALAQRLGQPDVAGWSIGELSLSARVQKQGSGGLAPQNFGIRWPGTPAPDGGVYEADLMMFSVSTQYMRCRDCTGPSGNGTVVIAPSSTLRNNVNHGSAQATVSNDPLGTSEALWTATIPWYEKFSGYYAPYGNDQHPYLIWNMYRVNPDGSLEQIGRSGVKHAFLTTNGQCLENNDHHAHALGRGCFDTYAASHNDSNYWQGERSEIIPATGQWGRCGSVFDRNCNGSGSTNGGDNFYLRLTVNESQISPQANPGARWLFESWYLAREDINIYNSMSTTDIAPRHTGSVWAVPSSNFRLGAVIDHWIGAGQPLEVGPMRSRKAHPRHMIEELIVDGGHAKVAVKVIPQPDGSWQYHYAVMNFDVAFVETSGAEPNLRVVSNHGFDGFTVWTGAGASVGNTVFRNGELDNAAAWAVQVGPHRVDWSAGVGQEKSLGWGTLYSFSFTSSAPPVVGRATLSASQIRRPQRFDVQTLVPRS